MNGMSDNVGEEAIQISSDRLEAEDTSGRVTFFGNVVARRGDLTLYAREVEIYSVSGARDFDRIDARGDVRIVLNGKVATGDAAIYYKNEEKIVLTGAPKVFQDGNSIEGEEITVFLKDERSVVTGGEEARVNAVFQPKGPKP